MTTLSDNSSQNQPHSVAEWACRIASGDVRAIARAITLIEDRGADAAALLSALRAKLPAVKPLTIGITGAAGSGKSTLSDALIRELRKDGRKVGVLAIDPSSAVSGGALLGDRIRMQAHGLDTGVLIRSMATRGLLGGVAAATRDAICILEAAGMDFIIVETVGVGQDEIAIAQLADVTVLILTPGAGDEVQTLKAGLMEIADIFALNKADDPAVDSLEANVHESFSLHGEGGPHSSKRLPPVIKTVATEGRGVPQLKIAIQELAATKARRQTPGHASGGIDANRVELDHLGVAVESAAESLKFYEDLLGLQVVGTYDIPQELTHVAMLPVGDARIELLEATQDDSPIGRFLKKRGPGLHHICLRVPDLAAAVHRLKQAGARLINEEPQTGAGGHRYVFVHPASAGGVLLELVQGNA